MRHIPRSEELGQSKAAVQKALDKGTLQKSMI